MDPKERFKDNPSGIITDMVLKKDWLPKDCYQDLGKWHSWDQVQTYVNLMKQVYAGGFGDWRMPTKEEALSLYDTELAHKDWEGQDIFIHPVFVTGAARYMWTSEVNEEGQALRINLEDGSEEFIDKTTLEHQATRLVRDQIQ
jgi:hypothetical protein